VLSPEITCALHMPANGRTENRKLTMAYIRAAERAGAVFHEGRRVAAIAARAGRAVGVRFDDGSVAEGDAVIVAAGSWSSQIAGLEADAIRIYPVRGQIVCFDARPGLFAPSLFSPEGILVPRRDGRILAGSVFEDAGFNKSVTMDGIARVVSAARKLAPSLAALPFREAWAGLRPASDDLLPVLGPSPSVTGVLYATGHFRSGILLSALTADAIAAIMMGRRPPIDLAPFSPARFQGRPSTRVDPHIKGR
jgi:glycine oxidase